MAAAQAPKTAPVSPYDATGRMVPTSKAAVAVPSRDRLGHPLNPTSSAAQASQVQLGHPLNPTSSAAQASQVQLGHPLNPTSSAAQASQVQLGHPLNPTSSTAQASTDTATEKPPEQPPPAAAKVVPTTTTLEPTPDKPAEQPPAKSEEPAATTTTNSTHPVQGNVVIPDPQPTQGQVPEVIASSGSSTPPPNRQPDGGVVPDNSPAALAERGADNAPTTPPTAAASLGHPLDDPTPAPPVNQPGEIQTGNPTAPADRQDSTKTGTETQNTEGPTGTSQAPLGHPLDLKPDNPPSTFSDVPEEPTTTAPPEDRKPDPPAEDNGIWKWLFWLLLSRGQF